MIKTKCNRCGGLGEGKNFDDASAKINHAVGLSRGKPCGDSYGCVVKVGGTDEITKPKKSNESLKIDKKITLVKE